MIVFPKKTPENIVQFCKGCSSYDEVMTKLKENANHFIQFFKTVVEDDSWRSHKQEIADKIVSCLHTLSQSGKLSLEQARTAWKTAQVARSGFVSNFADDNVILRTRWITAPILKSLL